ncbi:hypothetical protein IF2G_04787 [Cordyceps javanica]|nr:hypothetical protein IF2G_04787 [Cordyceps javanica]
MEDSGWETGQGCWVVRPRSSATEVREAPLARAGRLHFSPSNRTSAELKKGQWTASRWTTMALATATVSRDPNPGASVSLSLCLLPTVHRY